jgi:hypothetical protein
MLEADDEVAVQIHLDIGVSAKDGRSTAASSKGQEEHILAVRFKQQRFIGDHRGRGRAI